MTKYTAADFENAKFAEHEDGGLATRTGEGYYTWEVGGVPLATDKIMARKGWVPVATKPTITESDYRSLTRYGNIHYQNGFNDALREFGIEVVDDPEPTNTELLEQLIRESGLTISNNGIEGYAAELAASLNEDGVTAPNVKGN